MANVIEEFTLSTDDVKVEKSDGNAVITIGDKDMFVNAAKDAGIEKQELKKYSKFATEYLKKAVKLSADEAAKVMKDDKDIKTAVTTIAFGINKSDKLDTFIERSRQYRNPANPDEVVERPIIRPVLKTEWSKLGKKYLSDLKTEFSDILG